MRKQQDLNGSPKLSECHGLFGLSCPTGRGCPRRWSEQPCGGPCSSVRHRWESRLLLSAGMDLLPTPGPSHLPAAPVPGTTGQYTVSLWVGLGLHLHLSPLAPPNFPDLPCLYPLQRLTTSLPLCSAMDLPPLPLLTHGSLAPRLVIISLLLPVILTSPSKTPALAGTAIPATMRHQLRHHSEGKKTPGTEDRWQPYQARNEPSVFIQAE